MSLVAAPVSKDEPCAGGLFHDFKNATPANDGHIRFPGGWGFGARGIQTTFRFCAHPECHAFQTIRREGTAGFGNNDERTGPWAVIDYKPAQTPRRRGPADDCEI